MGSLWGSYDEAANAASFKDAVSSWRTGEPEPALPPPPGMGVPAAAAPAPAPAPAHAVAAACYECMRRFTSAGVQCPHSGKNFCSRACHETYSQSSGGQAALNAALNKQAEPSVAAMGQAQAALPKRALTMPSGKDKLGRSSLDQLRMRLSKGGGPRGRGRARGGRGGGRAAARNSEYEAGREAVTASFVAAENAAKQAGMAASARAGAMQQQNHVSFAASTSSSGAGEDSEMQGTGGGGSLWGTYDEAANAASFKDAVASFRTGAEPAPEPEQEPAGGGLGSGGVQAVKVAKSSCYECFKLFPTADAVMAGGRSFCSKACAPAASSVAASSSGGNRALGTPDQPATATAAAAMQPAAAAAAATAAAAASESDSPGGATLPLPYKPERPPSRQEADRGPPPAGQKWCARAGCEVSFVAWKGVAVITADRGPLVFCSEACCPST
jgi:hypothetical protein